MIALLSARLLPASQRISDFVAYICISNISDGSTGRDLNIVTITKNNLIGVGVERGCVVILKYIEKFREIISLTVIQRATIPTNENVNETADVKRKAEIYFNLSHFFVLIFF